METVEIYKKPEGAVVDKEQTDKYLNSLSQNIESLKNWQEYYRSFGLQGQAELFAQKAKYLRKKKLFVEKGIPPYPQITAEQIDVLNSVFNCCVPAEEFSAQSMPSEVVAAYIEAKEYKDVGVFSAINVMYYDGDPILIAETAHEPKGDGKYYLLARWGDGLKPWEWFMNHYLKQKRANITSLRLPVAGVVASTIILAASHFLFLKGNIFESFILAVGVMCFFISASSLVARFRHEKSYSRALNEPIPSPFAIPT